MAENPTKKCPACQMDVPEKATKCPYCQSKIKMPTSPFTKWFLAITLPTIFIIIAVSGGTDSAPRPKPQTDPKVMASIYAEMTIKRLLKAPASADFCSDTVTDLGDNRYDVTSCVDSENSYGAKLRSNWQVIYKFSGGDPDDAASWIPEKIVFDGEVIHQSE